MLSDTLERRVEIFVLKIENEIPPPIGSIFVPALSKNCLVQ